MFFDFSEQLDMYNVEIDIEIDGQLQKQTIGAPKMFIVQQFLSLVQQAINTNQRIYVKMTNYIPVYSEKTGETKNMPSALEFKNNAYLDYEEATSEVKS